MKQENEFVLPEKWCIKGCKELSEYFNEFGLNNRKNKQRSDILYPLGGDCEDQYYYQIKYPSWDYDIKPKGIEITFNQFREHVLGEVKETMNLSVFNYETNKYKTIAHSESWVKPREVKTIIGYKLIKPEYKEAFAKLMDIDEDFICISEEEPFHFTNKSDSAETLKLLDILDIWCEPVYDSSITLKSGVKLSEDDIAEVKQLINIKYGKP